MSHISEKDQEVLKKMFSAMQNDVKIILFTQEFECEYCQMTHELMKELAQLSDKISLEIYDFVKNEAEVAEYKIEEIPAIVVRGEKDHGIRFLGIPAGYEFGSLIEDIMNISKGATSLSAETKEALSNLKKPLHIKVFVTPTCPHCPRAVLMAHEMALESDMVTADMIEVTEFPHLAHHYDVGAVPKMVVNETVDFVGAVPEPQYLEQVLRAATD